MDEEPVLQNTAALGGLVYQEYSIKDWSLSVKEVVFLCLSLLRMS